MKIIYLEEKEVKMGDKVSLNGAVVTVTQQLIDDLPNLFKVQDEQEIMPEYVECISKSIYDYGTNNIGEILPVIGVSAGNSDYILERYGKRLPSVSKRRFKPSTKEAWLLQEAKRRYPRGTFIYSLGGSGRQKILSSDFKLRSPYTLNIEHHGNCLVYQGGQWAEIVKPLFTTEDGVDVYEDESKVTVVRKSNMEIAAVDLIVDDTPESLYLYFSTREAAEEYIAKHKEKTLEDYENELLSETDELFEGFWKKGRQILITKDIFYQQLKISEPKLYWSKVLQLIADDLNGGLPVPYTAPDFTIVNYKDEYKANDWFDVCTGAIIFYSKSGAEKAIKIMGDKLDLIYKQ